ncbi:hypothetical protein T09_2040 [Trichinella sp. T9]|nr:hypothetical protein T09_2040 [Trichinella sp. T9]
MSTADAQANPSRAGQTPILSSLQILVPIISVDSFPLLLLLLVVIP